MALADDRVAAQIAEAKKRWAAQRQRRAELNAARQHGLRARHAAKLARLAARESDSPANAGPDSVGTADDRSSPAPAQAPTDRATQVPEGPQS